VIGVAMLAFRTASLDVASVETPFAADIRIDLVVAIPAQPALSDLAEGFVAALAFVLVSGVSLHQGAWHHQALDTV